MKILIISNMYPSSAKPYAGIFVENQFKQIKASLPEEDSIDIFYMERRFTSRWGSFWKYIKAFLGFIKYLGRDYDIVHLHFFYPLIYMVWVYKKFHPNVRTLVTFHGEDVTRMVNDRNKKHLQKIAKVIDFTIPVGSTIASVIKDKLLLKTGMILPVGVNNNVFYYEEGTKKTYDFIWIGSFITRKGIDTVLKAIRELSDKELSFCFCGSGEYLDDLLELKKEFDINIKQNQTQEQLRELLNRSKFFFLMSRNEGFPTATIEAMYCGVPVITSDIPQFKEQVQEGYNGYIVPLNDSEALVKKFKELKNIPNSDYLKLRSGALNSFKELSLQRVCDELIRIYRKLLEV